MRKLLSLLVVLLLLSVSAVAKELSLLSPDGKTKATIWVGATTSYSLMQDGEEVLEPSTISMTISDGKVVGEGEKIKTILRSSANEQIETPFFKDSSINDNYNQISIVFVGDWSLEFRAYNDGVAYRFVSKKVGEYEVVSEQSDYNFSSDFVATVPYVPIDGDLEAQLFNSFENIYTVLPISQLDKNKLMFLPLSVEVAKGKRVTITESDLRDYPGMYLKTSIGDNSFNAYYARVRKDIEEHSGYNNLQVLVKSRHNFIARVDGARSFPWRAAIISRNDLELANSSLCYKLAEPNVIGNTDWIKPGKVAWDWWNDWNLEGVDFKAGVNNQTYKYYIDFASQYGIEYVILDEGWSVNKVYDLMRVVPEIDIPELIAYGEARGVGIILWAGYYAFDKDMEAVCKHYKEMGVKGFKIDFMNGDDQDLVYFNERSAAMCAKYELLVDLHGTYKPAGLHRTYPNILNFEGVFGLEQMKWQPSTVDHVEYSVTMPFIRMVSGPVDYTQGAMTNAVKSLNTITNTVETQYYPNFTNPMSQGTRAHQLAQYVIYLSPLNMLCDTPTNYEKNPVSTQYIAQIPTVWDYSNTIQGEMGKFIVTARRKGDVWYIGGLNNWDAREITLDIESIIGKKGSATIYKDGVNADKNGIDLKKESFEVGSTPITVRMAPGGGFAIRIE